MMFPALAVLCGSVCLDSRNFHRRNLNLKHHCPVGQLVVDIFQFHDFGFQGLGVIGTRLQCNRRLLENYGLRVRCT